jgi:hypothetical protein
MWQLLIPAITSIIDKVIPDEKEANAAKLRAMEMAQNGELKQLEADVELAKGQMAINQVEAAQDNFRGGWRPAVGWVCVFGLFYQFILQPLLPWIVALLGITVPPLPTIDTESLMVLLFGILGLGGLRTMERVKGKV